MSTGQSVSRRESTGHGRADGGPSSSTTLWLATVGGAGDRTRIVLTAIGAAVGTLALTAAATVAFTKAEDGPYTSEVLNQPGLHPGVVVALAALCLPVLAFTGQCARIGAPARDRRLAALRMQGASPGDVVRIAAVETGLSGAVGAVLGMVLYFVLRVLLGGTVQATYNVVRPVIEEKGTVGSVTDSVTGPALRLPTDVLPPWPVLLLLLLVIPAATTLFAALSLRRVAISPLGVVRGTQQQPPRTVPALLFVIGTAGLALNEGLPSTSSSQVLFLLMLLVTGLGLLLGTTALASTIGQFLAVRTSRPSVLIAGRRMLAAPGQGGRAAAALLFIVLLWAFATGYRANLLAYGDDNQFYSDTTRLLDVAFAVAAAIAVAGLLVGAIDGVVARRRVLAGLRAAGTPAAVLERSVLAEVILPIALPVVLAAVAGILGARGVFGTSVTVTAGLTEAGAAIFKDVPIGVPWIPLALLVLGTLLAVLVVTAAALPLLRRSTAPSELRTA